MDQRVGYFVKRVQQALRQAMDGELRPLNLTTPQYSALSALEQTSNASNADLARACFVTPQTMTEIIRGLEGSGLITRQAHPEHGRIIQTFLTSTGRTQLATAHQVVGKVEHTMLSGLTGEEQKELAQYLQRCFENLESI
jgi:DNA-binding MarR family transcriptional regulator